MRKKDTAETDVPRSRSSNINLLLNDFQRKNNPNHGRTNGEPMKNRRVNIFGVNKSPIKPHSPAIASLSAIPSYRLQIKSILLLVPRFLNHQLHSIPKVSSSSTSSTLLSP
jgi:hypothetical protein